jgi:hypothetical protein
VLHHYWPNFRDLARLDLQYGTGLGWQTPLWYLGILLAAAMSERCALPSKKLQRLTGQPGRRGSDLPFP